MNFQSYVVAQNFENTHHMQLSVSDSFLPSTFEPGQNDVVIGRGRKCNYHKGNERLRRIVVSRLEEYLAASKDSKSEIISSIVDQVKMGTPKGAFVKKDLSTRLWFNVRSSIAREKVSRMFRDAFQQNCKFNAFIKDNHQMETKYPSADVLNNSQSKNMAIGIKEKSRNSLCTNFHFLRPCLTNFDVTAQCKLSQPVERVKKGSSSPNGNFLHEDQVKVKEQFEMLECEHDMLPILQTFIDFTKTDEFEKFDITKTYIHFKLGK